MRNSFEVKGNGSLQAFLHVAQFFFAEAKVVADFVQQGIANLFGDLRFSPADGLNVFLVEEDVVRRVGSEDAFQSSRYARKKSQQQTAPIRLLRRRIFNDDGKVGQPAAKRLGQVLQDLAGQLLKTLTFHEIILHATGRALGST